MTNFEASLEGFRQSYAAAQQLFGRSIKASAGRVVDITQGDGLDVLLSGAADDAGFRHVEVGAQDYLSTPQILGRVLLMQSPREDIKIPAVIVPKLGAPGVVRVAYLAVPFVPHTGLTPDLKLGLAVEAETQAPGFGGEHSAYEPGHFGSVLLSGLSGHYGKRLAERGDQQSHELIADGLPRVFSRAGLLTGLPVPKARDIDTLSGSPMPRLPLYWHENLQDDSGATLAEDPQAVELIIGAAIYNMRPSQLERAKQFVDHAAREAEYV